MDPKIDPKLLLNQATAQGVKAPNKRGQDPEKLRGATQQFEAVFIQQIFKEMRNTIPNDGLLQRGNAEDVFNQLQDAEVAKVMSERGGIGLSELMLQELLKNQPE